MLKYLVVLLLSFNCFAQEFPVGVPVESTAIFCETKEDAQVIADAKGEPSPEIEVLIHHKRCFLGRGRGTYTKEVYRNKNKWMVWEFKTDTRSYYEPTNWTPFTPNSKAV